MALMKKKKIFTLRLKKIARVISYAILVGIVLAGCGQRGPLYLPNDENNAKDKNPSTVFPTINK